MEAEHRCDQIAKKGVIIYLSRDEWFLMFDDNSKKTEINFCPYCGKILNEYSKY